MEKKYHIRQANWSNLTEDAIPKDSAEVMKFFNDHIENKKYFYVPRKGNPITIEEIKNIWMPTKDKTITFLAIDTKTDTVIASATIFPNRENTIGELSITKNLEYDVRGVGTDLATTIIDEAHRRGMKVSIHTSVENDPMIKIMEKLGYQKGALIKKYEKYIGTIWSTNYDVYYWLI